MNPRRPPSRAHNQARALARLRRMRHHQHPVTELSIELGVLRALAQQAADPRAPLDLRALPCPSEQELLERILGHTP
jgi:hypothetical protein